MSDVTQRKGSCLCSEAEVGTKNADDKHSNASKMYNEPGGNDELA